MRGGKRNNSGRKKLDHIRKTFYLSEESFGIINNFSVGKTMSEKLENIIKYAICVIK